MKSVINGVLCEIYQDADSSSWVAEWPQLIECGPTREEAIQNLRLVVEATAKRFQGGQAAAVPPSAPKGFWKCDHCGIETLKEEEVTCWKCGRGEMIYYRRDSAASVDSPPSEEQVQCTDPDCDSRPHAKGSPICVDFKSGTPRPPAPHRERDLDDVCANCKTSYRWHYGDFCTKDGDQKFSEGAQSPTPAAAANGEIGKVAGFDVAEENYPLSTDPDSRSFVQWKCQVCGFTTQNRLAQGDHIEETNHRQWSVGRAEAPATPPAARKDKSDRWSEIGNYLDVETIRSGRDAHHLKLWQYASLCFDGWRDEHESAARARKRVGELEARINFAKGVFRTIGRGELRQGEMVSEAKDALRVLEETEGVQQTESTRAEEGK